MPVSPPHASPNASFKGSLSHRVGNLSHRLGSRTPRRGNDSHRRGHSSHRDGNQSHRRRNSFPDLRHPSSRFGFGRRGIDFSDKYDDDQVVAIAKQVAAMDAKVLSKKRTHRSRFLIDPRTSKWIGWWDLVLTLALLFTATFTPFEVGFTGIPLNRWQDPLFLINRVVDVVVRPQGLERSQSMPRPAVL